MSDKTIAAMTLALEALEDFRFAAGFDRPLAQDAIDALREALAEQRLTNMQQKMERSIESLEAALVQELAASNTKTEQTHA